MTRVNKITSPLQQVQEAQNDIEEGQIDIWLVTKLEGVMTLILSNTLIQMPQYHHRSQFPLLT